MTIMVGCYICGKKIELIVGETIKREGNFTNIHCPHCGEQFQSFMVNTPSISKEQWEIYTDGKIQCEKVSGQKKEDAEGKKEVNVKKFIPRKRKKVRRSVRPGLERKKQGRHIYSKDQTKFGMED